MNTTATSIAVRLPPEKERQWKAEAVRKWEAGFIDMWQKDEAAKAIRNPCRQMLNECGAPEVNLLLQGHYYGTNDQRPRKRASTPNIIRRNKAMVSKQRAVSRSAPRSHSVEPRLPRRAASRAETPFQGFYSQDDANYRQHMLMNRKKKLNLYGETKRLTAADCVMHLPARAATPPRIVETEYRPRIITGGHRVAWNAPRDVPPSPAASSPRDAASTISHANSAPAAAADYLGRTHQFEEPHQPARGREAQAFAAAPSSDVASSHAETASLSETASTRSGSKVPLMAMKQAKRQMQAPAPPVAAEPRHAAVGTAQRGIKTLRQVAHISAVNPPPTVSVAHNHLTTFRKEGGVVVAEHSEHRRVPPVCHGVPVCADQRSPIYYYSPDEM
eukprot:TRINITY_DN2685_c0_g1_i1.p1 TRINITY_DN2685_c0_g1~~TRINITY_DN2685_c0_g1_i1.p1  ORF type:complete len:388 (-),score=41.36 TRINITY_DN2685_c0_g1_i1:77-1240(-)